MTQPTLAELEIRVERLDEQLRNAQRLLRQAREDAAEFHVDDVVEAKSYDNDPWRVAIIRRVSFRWSSRAEYIVAYRSKDGSWSKQERTAYSGVRKVAE